MPLKLFPPRKDKTPYYSVRGTYLGIHIDRSTKTSDPKIAKQILKKFELDIQRGKVATKDAATFADAALAYMKAGGDRRPLAPLLEYFGETALTRIDQAAIDAAALALFPNVMPATREPRSLHTSLRCAEARWRGVQNPAT
jgi:hypothetical protein